MDDVVGEDAAEAAGEVERQLERQPDLFDP